MRRFVPLLAFLASCSFVGQGKYARDIQDYDQDGVIGDRFGGADCRDDDPNVTTCDFDADGARDVALGGDDCDDRNASVYVGAAEICDGVDDDCDGLVDDADPDRTGTASYFADGDADGFGDPDSPTAACEAPPGFVADSTDCDDGDDGVNPGAPEFCDAQDRDCDGDPVRDAVDPADWYADADEDGFGAGAAIETACEGPSGTVSNADDCDDAASSAYPGADEIWYDGIDQDCAGDLDDDQDGDGTIVDFDCDDLDPLRFPGADEICNGGIDDNCNGSIDDQDPDIDDTFRWTFYLDADRDGYGGDSARYCPNSAPGGWILIGGDCDDARPSVAPSEIEVCDDLDNDCNGAVDDGAIGRESYFLDADGDGHGQTEVLSCDLDPGLAVVGDDCNDADPGSYPGAVEVCGDLIRQDCSATPAEDCDADGSFDPAFGGDDCDDTAPAVFPGAREVCDGLDGNCNGIDDANDPLVDLTTATDWYEDLDGDAHGTNRLVAAATCYPGPGASILRDDCDDADPDAFPGALEVCDGSDDDCDGVADDAPVAAPIEWHLDADGDGSGDPDVRYAQGCAAPIDGNAWVQDGLDCDDGDAAIAPTADEICDGSDQDCDGLVDDADPDVLGSAWYRDSDGDGWGVSSAVSRSCAPPSGYVGSSGDCNDSQVSANPGATEVCDAGIDNDCDGNADDADSDLSASTEWAADADGDGFGDPNDIVSSCGAPFGRVANQLDCDDASARINPSALEICDAVDDDCDALVDDLDSDVFGYLFYVDSDHDGYGGGAAVSACSAPIGTVQIGGDCDDSNPATNPAAQEVCGAADADCDGLVDQADPDTIVTEWADDGDGDGYAPPGAANRTAACTRPTGQGLADLDCDDASADVSPVGVEVCNSRDDDCDGLEDEGDIGATYYVDRDRDGYGDPALTVVACSPLVGYSANDLDCDDFDLNRSPAATERCNGVDDDCDALVDLADGTPIDAFEVFSDSDRDGYGTAPGVGFACAETVGLSRTSNDCNDGSAAYAPGRPEICDGYDNDCDLAIDNSDPDVVGVTVYPDADGDGFGAGAPRVQCPGSGVALSATDCDDLVATVHPGALEVCDGQNQDCDGSVDEGAVDAVMVYPDGDNDGYGVGAGVLGCVANGLAANGLDCDDGSPGRRPGNPEICNGIDEDCSGVVDDNEPGDGTLFTPDLDGDGHGSPYVDDWVRFCAAPPGFVAPGFADDCDPYDRNVFLGADERCNGYDDDCDGNADDLDLDDFPVDGTDFYMTDADFDGWGDEFGTVVRKCVMPVAATQGIDCDDGDTMVYPGADEFCGTVDYDCDAVPGDFEVFAVDGFPIYWDMDEDGYGVDFAGVACATTNILADRSGDCDDDDDLVNPGEDETCAVGDENCNGVDELGEAATDALPYFLDRDDDGHGDTGAVLYACSLPADYSNTNDDCDDFDSATHIGAPEVCGGGDENCSGVVDESAAIDATDWKRDLDGDGWGDNTDSSVAHACTAPVGDATPGDCNDSNANIHDGAIEICDSIDNDCDTLFDQSDPSVLATTRIYADLDNDGYGVTLIGTACSAAANQAIVNGDCDDTNLNRNPGKPEICDSIDNDCDSLVDVADASLAGGVVGYNDGDLDGYGQTAVLACSYGGSIVGVGGDCDDADPKAYPDAVVYVGSGLDYTTVTAALAAVCDGTEIVVRAAGSAYLETPNGTISTNVTIRGESPGNPPRLQLQLGRQFKFAGDVTLSDLEVIPNNSVAAIEAGNGGTVIGEGLLFDGSSLGERAVKVLTGGRFECTDCGFQELGSGTSAAGVAFDVIGGDVVLTDCWADALASNGAGTFVTLGVGSEFVGSGIDLSGVTGGTDGSAFSVAGNSTAYLQDVSIANPSPTRFAVDVSGSGASLMWNRGVITGGAGVRVRNNGSVILRQLDVTNYQFSGGIGLSAESSASFDAQNVTLFGLGLGLAVEPTVTSFVFERATVVRNSGGISVNVPTSMSEVVLYKNGSSFAGDGDVLVGGPFLSSFSTSGVGVGTAVPAQNFVTFDVSLAPSKWDLHVEPGSSIGTGGFSGGEVGRYGTGSNARVDYYDDTDLDGLFDGWELKHFGALTYGALDDNDGDGLTNSSELGAGTWPALVNTDADSLGKSDYDDPKPLDPTAN